MHPFAQAQLVSQRRDELLTDAARRRLVESLAAPVVGLTEPEHEVLVEVATGATDAEIAARLFLTEATVSSLLGRAFAKLGLRDRVQAVVFAYEAGLVRPRRR